MDMDLSQFYQMFFEESLESLDQVETTLLGIDVANYSDDEINLIFRCMHSLKGGSATFGFSDISEFTHTVETYLDDVRNRVKDLSLDTVDLLLKVIDASRNMILKHQGDEGQDVSMVSVLHDKFKALNNAEGNAEAESPMSDVTTEASTTPEEQSEPLGISGWYLYFKPHSMMMQKGNDPLRMIHELKKLGSCIVVADTTSVPRWESIEPELSYLAWHIYFRTELSEEDIKQEVFDWVIDECTLQFIHQSTELMDKDDLIKASKALTSRDIPEVDAPVSPKEDEPPSIAPIDAEQPKISTNKIKAPVEKVPAAAKPAAPKEVASIRVATDKVDAIINLVGELVITQAILHQLLDNKEKLSDDGKIKECLSQFSHNIRELQESAMMIRMLPISNVFNRFPRMVRDMAQAIGKKVELKLSGENTELDKTVMEKIGDPLVHLVRNSLDHGIEDPKTRLERGKSEFGTLLLNAYHQGSNILIDISDDGNGLNTARIKQKAIEKGLVDADQTLSADEINALIFLPGFSTAETITDISGRGVGMDVVKKNIQMVGGSIHVSSTPGQGSVFSISLPLTLSIIDGQILMVADQTFIIPLGSIIEIIQMKNQCVSRVGEGNEVYFLRNKYIPIIHLTEVLDITVKTLDLEGRFLVIISVNQTLYGIVIDDLLAQQQVVIKNIDVNYKHIDGIAGATVLGDGSVALILDVTSLVHLSAQKKMQASNEKLLKTDSF